MASTRQTVDLRGFYIKVFLLLYTFTKTEGAASLPVGLKASPDTNLGISPFRRGTYSA